jgi:hypothetical protein
MNASNPTYRNLSCGDVVLLRCNLDCHKVRFLGFSDWDDKHSDVPLFANWNELSDAKGLKNFKALDAASESREYGRSVYAIFVDLDEGFVFSAYRFNGFWAVGSSADRAGLEAL